MATARIYIDIGSYEDAPTHNQAAMREMGDHCGHGYRVVVESMLLPLPFVRCEDAKAAGAAIGKAMVDGTVPRGWPALRQFMLEALPW